VKKRWLKFALAGLLTVFMAGCVSLTPEQQCIMIHGAAATTTATIIEGQDTGEAIEIVEGVDAAISLIEKSTTDSTALKVIAPIKCATEGVMEGMR